VVEVVVEQVHLLHLTHLVVAVLVVTDHQDMDQVHFKDQHKN
jgi:hypothetical protein